LTLFSAPLPLLQQYYQQQQQQQQKALSVSSSSSSTPQTPISPNSSASSLVDLYTQITACAPSPTTIRLSFRSGGMDKFYDEMAKNLQKKVWYAVAQQQQQQQLELAKKREFTTSSAGVTGILKKVEAEDKKAKDTMNEAFSDLNTLMDKARDLVTLAEKFAEKMKKAAEQQSKEEADSEQQEFDNMLVSIGLGSIVTKASAGALFHKELARQLVDFLKIPIEKEHGMMLMTDAYCLYNRARGTDLISPEDMKSACSLFDSLALELTVKKFDNSGVIVILSSK